MASSTQSITRVFLGKGGNAAIAAIGNFSSCMLINWDILPHCIEIAFK